MWLVLIRCEGKVLLGGWWPWLICCERKELLAGWLPANRTGQTTITSQSLLLYGTIRQWQTLWLLLLGHNLPSFCNIFSRIHLIYIFWMNHLIYMDLRSRRKTVAHHMRTYFGIRDWCIVTCQLHFVWYIWIHFVEFFYLLLSSGEWSFGTPKQIDGAVHKIYHLAHIYIARSTNIASKSTIFPATARSATHP